MKGPEVGKAAVLGIETDISHQEYIEEFNPQSIESI